MENMKIKSHAVISTLNEVKWRNLTPHHKTNNKISRQRTTRNDIDLRFVKCFTMLFFIVTFSFSQYSLKVENIGGAKRAGEFNRFRAVLMNNGTPIHTFDQNIPFDVPFPATYVHEKTGIVIVSHPFDGFVEVYNGKGIKIWEQNFFKEMGPNYERTITVALGEKSIAFLTSDVTLPNAVAHKFNVNGAKELETLLPHRMGYEIVMSADEQTIIAGSYFVLEDEVRQSASIIDAKGEIVGDINILFRKGIFSDDNKFIALASEREVVTVNAETKTEIARAPKQTEGIITDMVWNNDELLVQESKVVTPNDGRFHYADPTFITYANDLKERSRSTINELTFHSSSLAKKNDRIVLNVGERTIVVSEKK